MKNINDVGGYILGSGTTSGFFGGRVTGRYSIPVPVPVLWTPSQLSDVSLWFDAADSTTFTLSTNNKVAKWNSKGSTTYYATQTAFSLCPTYSANTLNSLPVITFNSTSPNSNQLILSGSNNIPFLSGGYTIAVYRWIFQDAFVVPRIISYYNATNDGWLFGPLSGASAAASNRTRISVRRRGIQGTTIYIPGAIDNNNYHLHAGEWGTVTNNSSLLTYYDGVSTTSTAATTVTPLTATPNLYMYMGSDQGVTQPGNFFNGGIAEIIMVNGYSNNQILPIADRQKIEGYLAWKWNLVSNLPATHPYKNAAPLV